MGLRLMIGNKNYSSWSPRPWIAMRVAGLALEGIAPVPQRPQFQENCDAALARGPGPGPWRCDVCVRETLAILEYLNEKFPAAQLWPADRAPRAHARALAAEMHAGFAPLRRECPMNMWRPPQTYPLSPEARGQRCAHRCHVD